MQYISCLSNELIFSIFIFIQSLSFPSISQSDTQTMVFQWLFNAYYSLNPFKNVRYKGEESLDLPALPDLSQYFQPYSVLGFKQNMDPRFPRNNFDMSKKCFTNFCVWRECLQQHSETLDEDDPNARICRQYKNLAKHTCTANWVRNIIFYLSPISLNHLWSK